MKKIAIIGGGISGLTIANLLVDKHKITLFEAKSNVGGIAKTRKINGLTYHPTGGHCFNSKYEDVLDFVFQIMPRNKWNKIERKSSIIFKNNIIPYPIEYSIKNIAKFDLDLACDITADYLSCNGEAANNLHDWFINNFGKRLALEYLIPYNTKIWNTDLKYMAPDWVSDKIPMPDKKSFIKSLIAESSDSMPHRFFYYPKSNDQNELIENLLSKIESNVRYNTRVDSITKTGSEWLINNNESFDAVISTIPMNVLPNIINSCPFEIIRAASELKYNKVTTMMWENDGTIDDTWTYIPDSGNRSHRHIHIGNFMIPKQKTTIVEVIGEVTYEEMLHVGKEVDYLKNPLAYNVSEHAYVVFDKEYSHNVRIISQYLNKIGLFNLGRFGEWEYYNMDVCMKSAFELCEKI